MRHDYAAYGRYPEGPGWPHHARTGRGCIRRRRLVVYQCLKKGRFSGLFFDIQKSLDKILEMALLSLAVWLRICCGYAATVKMDKIAKKQHFRGEFAGFDGLTDWESFANPGLAYKMT